MVGCTHESFRGLSCPSGNPLESFACVCCHYPFFPSLISRTLPLAGDISFNPPLPCFSSLSVSRKSECASFQYPPLPKGIVQKQQAKYLAEFFFSILARPPPSLPSASNIQYIRLFSSFLWKGSLTPLLQELNTSSLDKSTLRVDTLCSGNFFFS